jgi:hypothetical protein
VLENISKHQLAEHLSDVLPTVQAALTDTDGLVRAAAGDAFAILFKGGSGSAVDSVVPSMIAGLHSCFEFQDCALRTRCCNTTLQITAAYRNDSILKIQNLLSTEASHYMHEALKELCVCVPLLVCRLGVRG